jgi:hypothetical protein
MAPADNDYKLFGIDIDDIFKLATPKYVYVRDWKLGALKYILMVMILFYVLGYDILYSCSHLVPHVASGYGSIDLKHPADCDSDGECVNDYNNIAVLPYCTESVIYKSQEKQTGTTQASKKETSTTQAKKTSTSSSSESKTTEAPSSSEVSDAEEDGLNRKLMSSAHPVDEHNHSDAEVGAFITPLAECRYLDNDRLTMEEVPNQIFVPMRYVSYQQEIADDCYDPVVSPIKGHTTQHKSSFRCKKSWETVDQHDFYVADIEHFTLSMKHSYMAPAIDLSGVSTGLAGFMKACEVNHPKTEDDCVKLKIPKTNYNRTYCAPEDFEGALDPADYPGGIDSLNSGLGGVDTISLGDLFRLTPEAHKFGWQEHIADRKWGVESGHPEHSLREVGGMMMLAVSYENTGYGRPGIPHVDLPSFFMGEIKPITYTYRPYFIPTTHNKQVEVLFNSDDSKKRTVNIWYGVTVKLSFEGSLTVFSMTVLLSTLTTALVLLTSATTIVTYMALYVMKASDKYTLMMYQYTEDFSDYKDLVRINKKNCKEPHKICPVSSPSGLLLAQAHMDESKDLTPKEIIRILTDYEVRLNRLDGMDPELAFPANPSDADKKDKHKAMAMRLFQANELFRENFLAAAKNWDSSTMESRETSALLKEDA